MKNPPPEGMIRKLAQSILTYLVDHPEAKDTIEGIEKYWIQQTKDKLGYQDDIREALEWLALQGWIKRKTPPQPSVIYSLNKAQMSAIREYLKQDNDA